MHIAVSPKPVSAVLATSRLRPGTEDPSLRTRSSTSPVVGSPCSQKKRNARWDKSSRKASSEVEICLPKAKTPGSAAARERKWRRERVKSGILHRNKLEQSARTVSHFQKRIFKNSDNTIVIQFGIYAIAGRCSSSFLCCLIGRRKTINPVDKSARRGDGIRRARSGPI